eukprot:scaffold5034_cov385-Prasinococcus_capsulatus_cf.AAC.7
MRLGPLESPAATKQLCAIPPAEHGRAIRLNLRLAFRHSQAATATIDALEGFKATGNVVQPEEVWMLAVGITELLQQRSVQSTPRRVCDHHLDVREGLSTHSTISQVTNDEI